MTHLQQKQQEGKRWYFLQGANINVQHKKLHYNSYHIFMCTKLINNKKDNKN